MKRVYHKWWSENLDRDMELLVFGHVGAKVLVFPTRDGRFYEYENLRITDVLQSKIEVGQLQLYCVDSIDAESFYCWWAHPKKVASNDTSNTRPTSLKRCFPSCTKGILTNALSHTAVVSVPFTPPILLFVICISFRSWLPFPVAMT